MKKKRITIIDILIVLAVAVAGVVVMKVMRPSGAASNGNVEFVVLAGEVDNKVAEGLKAGDKAILSQTQKTEVTISEVRAVPSRINVFDNETLEYKTQESELKSDVYVTVNTDANISDTAIVKDDVFIRVGEEVSIDSKNLSVKGHIVEINNEEK